MAALSATVVLYVRREERTASWASWTRFSSVVMRAFRASMPEYPVRSLMRCEAMNMLPWRWSMRWENLWLRAERRPSSAEGSSEETSSGRVDSPLVSGFGAGLEGVSGCVDWGV